MALAVPLLRIGPAADEQGVKRFTAGGWIAFVAPAGFTTGALPPERFTEQLRRELARTTTVLEPIPDDAFLCSFSHIFAGGYSAGYYS
jgi:hypothetical protein